MFNDVFGNTEKESDRYLNELFKDFMKKKDNPFNDFFNDFIGVFETSVDQDIKNTLRLNPLSIEVANCIKMAYNEYGLTSAEFEEEYNFSISHVNKKTLLKYFD